MKTLTYGLLVAVVATALPVATAIGVSKEPAPQEKAVPDVIGKKWHQGTAELAWEGFDFDLELDWDCPSDKLGKVLRTVPGPGTMAKVGSTVVVWYMPDGKTEPPNAQGVQWIRTGPVIMSDNKEGRLPLKMQVSEGSLTYTAELDGQSHTNTVTWSDPPALIAEGEEVKLTMNSTGDEKGALVGGWWNLSGYDLSSYKGTKDVGSGAGSRRAAAATFKLDRSQTKASMQVSGGHDPAPDTWVLVTYTYTRQPAGNSVLYAKPEDAARKKNVLDMSPEEFAADKQAQQELFEMARTLRDWQKQFAEDKLKKLGIETREGMVVSKMKRDELADFVAGVIAKCKRNGYDRIGRMDDIARGRFNMRSQEEVDKVIKSLLDEPWVMMVVEVEGPRRPQPGGGFGYPRWHIIMQDPQTGLRYEWQLGTAATSKLYETPGIPLPKGVELGEGMHTDIHDIEYDILRSIKKVDPELHQRLGIPAVHDRVDAVSAQSGLKGDAEEDLDKQMKELHVLVGAALQKVVDEKGPEWIKQFYH